MFLVLLSFKPILKAIGIRSSLNEEEQTKHEYLVQYTTLVYKVYIALNELRDNHPNEILKYMNTVTEINGISTDYPMNVKLAVEEHYYSMFKSNPNHNIDLNFALRHILYPDIF